MDYQDMQEVATDLLSDAGSPGILRTSVRAFDPATGKTTTVQRTITVSVVQMDVDEALRTFNAIDIAAGQQGAYVAVPSDASFIPQNGDTIFMPLPAPAVTWKVDTVFPLAPGGLTLLYKVKLTK